MAAAVAEGREIPVGIPRRMVEDLFRVEPMSCVPYFATINSSNGWDVVAVFVMVRRHQGGVLAAVEVVMVIMTFRSDPMGVSRSRSTGK